MNDSSSNPVLLLKSIPIEPGRSYTKYIPNPARHINRKNVQYFTLLSFENVSKSATIAATWFFVLIYFATNEFRY